MTITKDELLEQARANKKQADQYYAGFKEELDGVTLHDEQELTFDELSALKSMSSHDLSGAVITAYKLGFSRSCLNSARSDKEELIKLLEMDELEFTKSIIDQVQDNLDDLNQLTRKVYASRNKEDAVMVLNELTRLSGRHEDMLNLTGTLLNNADDKIQQSLAKIYKRGNQ